MIEYAGITDERDRKLPWKQRLFVGMLIASGGAPDDGGGGGHEHLNLLIESGIQMLKEDEEVILIEG